MELHDVGFFWKYFIEDRGEKAPHYHKMFIYYEDAEGDKPSIIHSVVSWAKELRYRTDNEWVTKPSKYHKAIVKYFGLEVEDEKEEKKATVSK